MESPVGGVPRGLPGRPSTPASSPSGWARLAQAQGPALTEGCVLRTQINVDDVSGGPNTYEGTQSSPLAMLSAPSYLSVCLSAVRLS